MSAATDDPTGIPIPSNRTYITSREVQEMRDEIKGIEGTLADPKARIEDRGGMVRILKRLNGDLERETPPDTTPDQRDAIAKEERALREEIVASMCSQEEMRKRPPGAVGKFTRGEASPAMKAKILRWKNLRRIQHKGDDDPDLSNIERFRPTVSTLNMDNAFIPGKDYFIPPASPQYQENWDRTFSGKEADPAEVDALKARLAELEKLVAGNGAAKRPASPKEILNCSYCDRPCKGNVGLVAHERQCKMRTVAPTQGDAA